MLVLTRAMGKSIVIGEGNDIVRIYVLEMRGTQVRIGIEAPKHIKIDRTEVRDKSDYQPDWSKEDAIN